MQAASAWAGCSHRASHSKGTTCQQGESCAQRLCQSNSAGSACCDLSLSVTPLVCSRRWLKWRQLLTWRLAPWLPRWQWPACRPVAACMSWCSSRSRRHVGCRPCLPLWTTGRCWASCSSGSQSCRQPRILWRRRSRRRRRRALRALRGWRQQTKPQTQRAGTALTGSGGNRARSACKSVHAPACTVSHLLRRSAIFCVSQPFSASVSHCLRRSAMFCACIPPATGALQRPQPSLSSAVLCTLPFVCSQQRPLVEERLRGVEVQVSPATSAALQTLQDLVQLVETKVGVELMHMVS